MLEILKADYLHEKVLRVEFNTDETPVEINFEEHLKQETRSAFKPLLEDDTFKNFRVDYTLSWLNGEIDMAPEYIYFLAHRHDSAYQDRFKEWGYCK